MGEDRAKRASREAEIFDEETEESVRDNGGSESDTHGDGECSLPKHVKCVKEKCKQPKCKWSADTTFIPEPLQVFDDKDSGVQPEYQLS